METLRNAIMRRDGLNQSEFDILVKDAKQDWDAGGIDLEDVLYDWFGVELDYVFDLLNEFSRIERSEI